MATEQDLDASTPGEDKIVVDAPQGVLLKSLKVRVLVEPETGAIAIYGYTADKTIQPFAVTGGVKVVDLPFVLPTIWVKRLLGGTTYKIEPWRENL